MIKYFFTVIIALKALCIFGQTDPKRPFLTFRVGGHYTINNSFGGSIGTSRLREYHLDNNGYYPVLLSAVSVQLDIEPNRVSGITALYGYASWGLNYNRFLLVNPMFKINIGVAQNCIKPTFLIGPSIGFSNYMKGNVIRDLNCVYYSLNWLPFQNDCALEHRVSITIDLNVRKKDR